MLLLTLPLRKITGKEDQDQKCPDFEKQWIHKNTQYSPPNWQESALTNIFSGILEAIKKGKKTVPHLHHSQSLLETVA